MIQMLQKKFVVTAMAAITLLLLVLLGAINGVYYGITRRQAEHTLEMLAGNEGKTPPRFEEPNAQPPGFFNPILKEDLAMSAPFFLVFFDSSGEMVRADVSRISSVTQEEAEELGKQIWETGEETGRIGRFQYRVADSREGQGRIVVCLDMSSQIQSVLLVLATSVCIGLSSWLLMLLLVILLSKRAIRPIAQNMERQKQFVTNAGHEIKTPLAIILANTDAMELHMGESKWSRNIRAQTVRLNGLMQNLLTLSRMEEGRELPLPTSEFSLSRLAEELLGSYREMAAMNGISVCAEIPPDIRLNANRESIAQLLTILLDNAVKYADSGGRIDLLLREEEKQVGWQIRNTCESLPDAEPERLFERFYRADSARTQKNGGYGIGLSVARAIVQAARGSITAAYEGEHALCFTVWLPRS